MRPGQDGRCAALPAQRRCDEAVPAHICQPVALPPAGHRNWSPKTTCRAGPLMRRESPTMQRNQDVTRPRNIGENRQATVRTTPKVLNRTNQGISK